MKSFLLICFLLYSSISFSYVDFNLSYTFSIRQIDGVETDSNPEPGSAKATTSGYTINWAWYMWEYTALELNYSETTQRLLDDREVATTDSDGDPFTIKEQDSTVVTQTSGVGIRQSFANRKARIIPSIAIGYAQYTTSGSTKYIFDFNNTESEYEEQQDKEVFGSSYASFSLRFRFTELMGLTLAAKTVMPEFDTDQASNNVTYSAGFSWLF